ncbi:unnamed protein product [Cochlearia groenlandica]
MILSASLNAAEKVKKRLSKPIGGVFQSPSPPLLRRKKYKGAERTAILLGFVGDRVLFCQFITDLWNSSTSEGKTFPFLSRYVGVSLPDITQSMRFVPFLQPFQRFWMTLRTRIQNSTSADLPSFSESFTNQTGQFLTFTLESGTSPGVRLFNFSKGRMKTFTSEGGMASRVPTAAVSESGM